MPEIKMHDGKAYCEKCEEDVPVKEKPGEQRTIGQWPHVLIGVECLHVIAERRSKDEPWQKASWLNASVLDDLRIRGNWPVGPVAAARVVPAPYGWLRAGRAHHLRELSVTLVIVPDSGRAGTMASGGIMEEHEIRAEALSKGILLLERALLAKRGPVTKDVIRKAAEQVRKSAFLKR
jgi:hypothetical protein